jgi:prepilin-type N-terminal cleavage/methylation domain-containing protein
LRREGQSPSDRNGRLAAALVGNSIDRLTMATTMRTARAISGRHGFSLMEMIVVLVLLGSLLL